MKLYTGGLKGRITDIDIRLLRVFKKVVECGSYSVAELDLNINRSTISVHISDLETRLGMSLLIRSRGRSGVVPTEQGHLVYKTCLDLFGVLEGVRERLNVIQSNLTGNLHIALPDDWVKINRFDFSSVINVFVHRAPEVTLKVSTVDAYELDCGLLDGRVDVSINFRIVDRPGLEYLDLVKYRSYLYCSSKNTLFNVSVEEMDAEMVLACKLVRSDHGVSLDAQRYYGMFERHSIANQMDGRMLMILSGLFVGFLPEHYAEEWERRGEIKRLMPEEFSYLLQDSLVFKKRARENPLVDLLVQIVENQLDISK